MALSIKSDEVDRLARALVAETGESLTRAVEVALRERLDRAHQLRGDPLETRVRRLQAEVAHLPVIDSRPADQIIGDDEYGLTT